MPQPDRFIQIFQVDGLNGAGGRGGASPQGQGNLADPLVNSALRCRGQAPLVDSFLADIGLSGNDLNGITRVLRGDQPDASAAADTEN